VIFQRDSLTYVAWKDTVPAYTILLHIKDCLRSEVKNEIICQRYSASNAAEGSLQKSALHYTVLHKGEVVRFGVRIFPFFGVLCMLLCRT
jgi:hypothetical protein